MFQRLRLLLAVTCLSLTFPLFSQQEWIPVGPDDFIPVVDQSTIVTAMAVNSSGIPYVAYQEGNEGNRITVRRNVNNNWEIVGQALISDGSAGELQLAFDVNDILYLAYADWWRVGKLTVQRFVNGAWEVVGQPGFSPGTASFVDLKIKSDGTPVVAYSDHQNAERTAVQEFVNGNWEYLGAPGVSSSKAQYNSLAINNLDEAHVIYADQNTNFKATVKKFTNGNWILLGSPGFSAGRANDAFITIAPNGEPHIAYSDTSNGSKILVQKFSNNTWTSVGTGLPNNPCGNPEIVFIPSTGEAYMTYNNYGFQGRHEVRRLTGSNFWSNTGNSQISKGDAQFLELHVTAADELFTKYTDAGFNFRTVVQKYNGTLWEVAGAPGIDEGNVDFTSMAVSPTGVPYIAFRDLDQNSRLTVKRQIGRNWETVGNPGFSIGQVSSISALFGSDGTFYVAYSDFSLGAKLTVKKHDGTQWSDVGLPGISAGIAGDITLKQSVSGQLYVGYRDQSNSSKATIQTFENNTWQTVGAVASNQGSVNGLKFAISPDNTPYISYTDIPFQQKLTVERFVNGSWEYVGSRGFSDGLSGVNDIEFSPNGEVFVAYAETTFSPTSVGVTVRKLNNNSWDLVGPARFSASTSNFMSLGFDMSGVPLIAFEDGANGGRVSLSKFVNGEWEALGGRGISGGKSSDITLDLGPNGAAFIGYTIGDAFVKRYDSRNPPVFVDLVDVEINEDYEGIVLDLESNDIDPEGDQEGSGLTYSFSSENGGVDNALFNLDPTTGELTFKEAPNFETPTDAGQDNVYNVQFRVTDLDGLSSVQNVSITVNNIALRYVTPSGSGTKDGTSWANAMDDLQKAFDRSAANETVWIASGTYYPTTNPFATGDPRDNAFIVDVPLTIYGGFNGTEVSLDQRDLQTNITLFSGDLNGDDASSGLGETLEITGTDENPFHILVLHNINGVATIDGIQFKGGNADGTGNATLDNILYGRGEGGAIVAKNCQTISLSNLVFENNVAISAGAGIGAGFVTSLELNQIRFERNIGNVGGGVRTFDSGLSVNSCEFLDNYAPNSGGGIWSINTAPFSIDNSVFRGNVCTIFGGALTNSSSSPVITNSTFQSNKAAQGGAIFNNNRSDSGFTADRILLLDNEAESGGAIAAQGGEFTLQNSVVFGNSATELGGAFWMRQARRATVINSTIVNNRALIEGSALWSSSTSTIDLLNSVFYQNFDPANPVGTFSIAAGILSNRYNAIDDGLEDNAVELQRLTSSPFVNFDDPDGIDNVWGTADDGLFPLELYSPLIDNALNIIFAVELDITGANRILNNRVDIGAYEYKGPFNQPPVISIPGAVTVEENSSAVIIDLESTDPEGEVEGNDLVYEFSQLNGGGQDNNLFQLSPQTGEISLIAAADFEQPQDLDGDNQYSLQVSVSDRGGLMDHLDFVISVINVEDADPTIACEPMITASTDPDTCTAILTVQEPQIDDDFSLVENLVLTVVRSDDAGLDLSDPFPLGTTTLTWTVMDESGKEASCTQQIEVVDNQAPTLICQSISIELDQNGMAEVDPLELYGESTDNCGITEVEFSRSLVFSSDDIGDNSVSVTVNDSNPNNTQTCTLTVTVIPYDIDGDGVPNADDLCPDTPANTQVDVTGCPIFTLPADNFLIRSQGSSCPGTQNGLIEVTAMESRMYTLRLLLDGNEVVSTEFDGTSWTSDNLGAGQYSLCLGVPEEPDYERCFTIALTEPESLAVSSKVISASRTVELSLSGAESYVIRHNDVEFSTDKEKVEIELSKGANVIEVRTSKECQGTFQKQFFWIDQMKAYPNPTQNWVVLNTSIENEVLPVRIFDLSGRVVTQFQKQSNALGEIELDLSSLEAALYIIRVGEAEIRVIKD